MIIGPSAVEIKLKKKRSIAKDSGEKRDKERGKEERIIGGCRAVVNSGSFYSITRLEPEHPVNLSVHSYTLLL
ncbi:hypothetical protein KQX54_014963 [Cotesia glomerata]|uniref:Uncharacterized protein n=1 Tax=Cotesia glomerata TaxID=32391 RepID=A0AAV7I3K2_COTGL|nr:hypothetical protein KQX54_014963 [Cotesia glomerata]